LYSGHFMTFGKGDAALSRCIPLALWHSFGIEPSYAT
jgi:hypothetical protein